MEPRYNLIGQNYADTRRPDPRIARQIEEALAQAQTIVNVGAGAGSYEPPGRKITAVDPSTQMIAQRAASNATIVQASAEELPFEDDSFDAAMAILTIHHWTDKTKGVAEMRRVARDKLVFLTHNPNCRDFWLFDYFPEIIALDEGQMPRMSQFESWLGSVSISTVPIPHDCTDGFLTAYWRRPAAYLDERVRSGMSPFWTLDDVSSGLSRLENELESGAWEERYGHLLDLDTLDCGYRLIETI